MAAAPVEWARLTELAFREIFADQQMVRQLRGERHWHIRAHGVAEDVSIGPGVFDEEVNAQKAHISEAVRELEGFQRLRNPPGEVSILDTNTLIHFQIFDQLLWPIALAVKRVRLVIPLVVLDELDANTYKSQVTSKVDHRARTVLKALDRYIDDATDSVAVVRDGVTLEILPDPPDHQRRAGKDTEILDRAEFLSQVLERAVVVISSDRGMKVRGRVRGIAVRALPDDLRRGQPAG